MWAETGNSAVPIGSATSLLEGRFSKLEKFSSPAYYINHDVQNTSVSFDKKYKHLPVLHFVSKVKVIPQ